MATKKSAKKRKTTTKKKATRKKKPQKALTLKQIRVLLCREKHLKRSRKKK